MRRMALWFAGAIVLCFIVNIVLAQEPNQVQGQSQGQVRRQYISPVVKVMPQDANRTSTSSVGTQMEPNGQAFEARQRESRKQMRERIREARNERNQMAPRGRTGPGRPIDANVPVRTKVGPKLRDVNAPLGKNIAEANQNLGRLTAIEQQLSQAEAKHRDRLARLNRIRELAQQQGNTEAVAQADKLLEEEQKRYDMVTQRMEHRKNRVEEFSKKAATEKDKRKIGEGGGKDINRPAAENK